MSRGHVRNECIALTLICIASILVAYPAMAQVPGVKHFVIIGVDGMSPKGIEGTETPVMDELMARGAYTFHARGVLPTSSSPNWASMIMGAGPEQHGITSNDWEIDKHDIPPIVADPSGRFPTIFYQIRQAKPDAVIACFHDWDGFGRLVEPDVPNVLEDGKGPVDTVEKAVAYFKKAQPMFTFIHSDHVDHAGHSTGWFSDVYFKAVQKADRLIGETIDGLKAAGMYDSTVILVTADHGGKGKGHGGDSLVELEIPWIIAGPGVIHGKELKTPINTYDTAATVAYALGVPPNQAWIAKPVVEAFGGPVAQN